jgi:hypothetical protein
MLRNYYIAISIDQSIERASALRITYRGLLQHPRIVPLSAVNNSDFFALNSSEEELFKIWYFIRRKLLAYHLQNPVSPNLATIYLFETHSPVLLDSAFTIPNDRNELQGRILRLDIEEKFSRVSRIFASKEGTILLLSLAFLGGLFTNYSANTLGAKELLHKIVYIAATLLFYFYANRNPEIIPDFVYSTYSRVENLLTFRQAPSSTNIATRNSPHSGFTPDSAEENEAPATFGSGF